MRASQPSAATPLSEQQIKALVHLINEYTTTTLDVCERQDALAKVIADVTPLLEKWLRDNPDATQPFALEDAMLLGLFALPVQLTCEIPPDLKIILENPSTAPKSMLLVSQENPVYYKVDDNGVVKPSYELNEKDIGRILGVIRDYFRNADTTTMSEGATLHVASFKWTWLNYEKISTLMQKLSGSMCLGINQHQKQILDTNPSILMQRPTRLFGIVQRYFHDVHQDKRPSQDDIDQSKVNEVELYVISLHNKFSKICRTTNVVSSMISKIHSPARHEALKMKTSFAHAYDDLRSDVNSPIKKNGLQKTRAPKTVHSHIASILEQAIAAFFVILTKPEIATSEIKLAFDRLTTAFSSLFIFGIPDSKSAKEQKEKESENKRRSDNYTELFNQYEYFRTSLIKLGYKLGDKSSITEIQQIVISRHEKTQHDKTTPGDDLKKRYKPVITQLRLLNSDEEPEAVTPATAPATPIRGAQLFFSATDELKTPGTPQKRHVGKDSDQKKAKKGRENLKAILAKIFVSAEYVENEEVMRKDITAIVDIVGFGIDIHLKKLSPVNRTDNKENIFEKKLVADKTKTRLYQASIDENQSNPINLLIIIAALLKSEHNGELIKSILIEFTEIHPPEVTTDMLKKVIEKLIDNMVTNKQQIAAVLDVIDRTMEAFSKNKKPTDFEIPIIAKKYQMT